MYETYFGFREQPFSNTPDPKFFLSAATHEAALASLVEGIARRKGFLVLTGDVGTGKSTLCRALLSRLGSEVDVALVLNPDLSQTEILAAIVRDFGLPEDGVSRARMMDALHLHLAARAREGKTALIVIDDAQNLPLRSLEQVRMISNFETDKEKLVQILLVGQPELDAKLEAPEFRQVAQRVASHPRLSPLTAEETRAYILHRLACVATPPAGAVFAEGAIKRIHRASRGYPRSINTLCDRALDAACREKRRRISAEHVRALGLEIAAPPVARRPATNRRRRLAGLAALAACAAALAAALLPLAARAPQSPTAEAGPQPRTAEKLATLERGLAALEQRLAALPETASLPAAPEPQRGAALEESLTAARGEAEGLRGQLRRKEAELEALHRSLEEARRQPPAPGAPAAIPAEAISGLEEREAVLKQAVDRLRGESQNRAEQIRHLERALETLKGRLGEAVRQREALSRSLDEQGRDVAAAGPDARQPAELERLQEENEQLRQTRDLLQRISRQTIEAQEREIERLNREKEELARLRDQTSLLLPATAAPKGAAE